MGEDRTPTLLDLEEHSEHTLNLATKLLTPGLVQKFQKIPEEYFAMSEEDLEKLVSPTKTDEMLRVSFWNEVRRVTEASEIRLKPIKVYDGVCTREHFNSYIVASPLKFAYILRPPPSHKAKSELIISRGTSKLLEALDAKLVYSNGHMDAKATKTVLDIVAYFESRMKGAVTQKVETKNLNVEVKHSTTEASQHKELDQKLLNLRNQIAIFEGQELVQDLPEKVKDVSEEKIRS
jgi:hypothetical protein